LLNFDVTAKLARLAGYWQAEGLLAAHQNLRAAMRAIAANSTARLTLDALTIKLKNLMFEEKKC
jgi:hypothetical protein